MRRLMLLIAIALTSATGSVAATHKITYLTGTTAYIDAGRDEGIVEGARIDVVRGGKVFTVLLVTDVSSHRAACAIASGVEGLKIGDAVQFTPAPV